MVDERDVEAVEPGRGVPVRSSSVVHEDRKACWLRRSTGPDDRCAAVVVMVGNVKQIPSCRH